MVSRTRESPGWVRRKRATHTALRKVALELALEHGIDAVRVEQIAERAGVSTRTFFNYFDGKDDAVLFELFTAVEEELDAFAVADPASPAAAWSDLARLVVTDVERVAADLPAYLELQRRHLSLRIRQLQHFAHFESTLGTAVAARIGRTGAGPMTAELMSGSVLLAVRVALTSWGNQDWNGSPGSYVEAAFAELAPAFAAIPPAPWAGSAPR